MTGVMVVLVLVIMGLVRERITFQRAMENALAETRHRAVSSGKTYGDDSAGDRNQ